nr:hypothetical protein [candidate division Zixibacteria bacterium]
MAAENKKQAQQAETIQIPGQGEKVGSELSVQLKPGTFVDMLSAEEKQAMEIFFDKYQGVAPRQGAYSNDGQTNSSYLGKQIDVKL